MSLFEPPGAGRSRFSRESQSLSPTSNCRPPTSIYVNESALRRTASEFKPE